MVDQTYPLLSSGRPWGTPETTILNDIINEVRTNLPADITANGTATLAAANAYTDTEVAVISPIGKHKIWVPAAEMRAATVGGPSSSDTVANDFQYYSLNFDQTTAEIAHFNISMPSSWDEGTVTFVPVWTAASGSGGVVWRLRAGAKSNDDAISGSMSNSADSADTLITAEDLHRGPESSALTIDGTPAANDTVFFRFARIPTDASDTLTADAKLIGIELFMTTAAAVDVS